VALSLPAIVGAQGATEIVEPEMDEPERQALERSAGVIRKALNEIGL
jgi:malate/lactate dehydrogenase